MLGYPGGPNVILRDRGQGEMRQGYPLAWKMERGTSQGMWWPLEAAKGKGMDAPLEPPEKNAALQTPGS